MTISYKSRYGQVTTQAQAFQGLKSFEGGLSNAEFVGTNPEVGGSSPFQLLSTNKRHQIINSGTLTVRLPSTGVKAGEAWRITNRSQSGTTTVTSSDGDTLDVIRYGHIQCVALQDNPTDGTHWWIMDLEERVENTTTSVTVNAGTVSATFIFEVMRRGHGPMTGVAGDTGMRTISIGAKVSGTVTSGTPTFISIAIDSRFTTGIASRNPTVIADSITAGLVRFETTSTGTIGFRVFNAAGVQQNIPGTFDFRATLGYAYPTT